MAMVPFRKIRANIESMQHVYSDYEYTTAISPNIFALVSGGMDSMFLLDFMSRCAVRFDVIHFVHGIRSADQSMADLQLIHNAVAEFNKTRTEHNQITVRVGYGEGLDSGSNIESRAHEQRWAFVNDQRRRIADEYLETEYVKAKRQETHEYVDYEIHNHCPSILAITAHHLDDNIEHTIMGLLRGKSHNTLPMQESQHMAGDARRFRPLLQVPKKIIEKLVRCRGIEYNEDYTNKDNTAERNWMRNVIIPQLQERRNLTKSMAAAMLG